jgi:hypothetical protein
MLETVCDEERIAIMISGWGQEEETNFRPVEE